jgi:hypothetical protein
MWLPFRPKRVVENSKITCVLTGFIPIPVEFHVARMQTEFCRSCLHRIKGYILHSFGTLVVAVRLIDSHARSCNWQA